MATQKLTKHIVGNTPAPAKGYIIIWDEKVKGLGIRITANGIRSFVINYRTRKGGVERRHTIGRADRYTVELARKEASAKLRYVDQGGDPVGEDQSARGESTMDDLWDRCEREHWCNGKGWDREAKRLFQVHVSPKLGNRRLKSIGYDDIARIHKDLKPTPIEANHAIAVVSKMLSLAERFGPEGAKWRDLNSNPCGAVERYPTVKRRRYAKPGEIAIIGPILEREAEMDPEGVSFIYLLAFSGARPSEIENGKPEQIERIERDGELVGVLRLDDGKTGPRNVFLPTQAMKVIDRLPKSRKSLAGRMPRRLWDRIRTEANCPDLWARDWRRTFATQALSSGMGLSLIGELLGHASPATTKIYARLMEDPAHAAAAQVAGRMETLFKPAANVVPMHKPDKLAS